MTSRPLSDPRRLQKLARSGLTDAEPEETFNRLAQLAARLLEAPVSMVSIVDDRSQRFLGETGWGLRQTPLSHSFCRHVVASGEPLIVSDARTDPRVRDNPAIVGLGVVAYAGVPLTTRDGHTLGSLCAIDRQPRQWTAADVGLLEDLSHSVIAAIELRTANRELARQAAELVAAEESARRQHAYSQAILRSMHEGLLVTREGRILETNSAFCELTGFTRDQLVGARVPYPFWVPEARPEIDAHRRAVTDGRPHELRTTYRRADGSRLRVSMHTVMVRAEDGEPLSFVTTVSDVTEQERHADMLEHLASHDALTGMPNRRVFQERLRAEIARAERHARPLSIAILDLDHFKEVNDRLGHDVGDRVLQEVARRLTRLVRRGEHIARIGGEEFGWILPDSDAAGACAAADRARGAISGERFEAAGSLTISAGVCELGGSRRNLGELFRGADQALYAAKRAGRDQTVTDTLGGV